MTFVGSENPRLISFNLKTKSLICTIEYVVETRWDTMYGPVHTSFFNKADS